MQTRWTSDSLDEREHNLWN